MILRKPYAFFIKYFRVINLIMAIFMAILTYQTIVIGKFLTNYIKDYSIGNNFAISNYINFYSFLMCILVIVLTIIVTSVMIVKKKPKKLYIFNLVVSIALFVLYIVDFNVMKNITSEVLDIRVSKAIRDITYIAIGFQILSFIITLIRATGFDLKEFDFGKDLQQLEINVKDNEEFEVAVEFDKNKLRRNTRKQIRNLNYFYNEHKTVINVIFIVLITVILFSVIMLKTMYSSNYQEGRIFTASSLQFNVKNSYITNTDQLGQTVVEDKILVVVKFDVRQLFSGKKKLNTGLITLNVENKNYGQTTDYNSYVTDIGTPYTDEDLTEDFTAYILVFAIPIDDADKKMKLKINDNVSYIRGEVGAKNNFIKLNPIDIDFKEKKEEKRIGDTLSFSDSTLGETTFKINKIEIANKFKIPYNFCYTKDKCFTSYKYITPSASGGYFKTLLKIDGEFEIDESLNLEINDMFDFLNEYGTLYLDGEEDYKEVKINSKRNNVSGKTIYIEVDKYIEQATNIELLLNVRNYKYTYILK